MTKLQLFVYFDYKNDIITIAKREIELKDYLRYLEFVINSP